MNVCRRGIFSNATYFARNTNYTIHIVSIRVAHGIRAHGKCCVDVPHQIAIEAKDTTTTSQQGHLIDNRLNLLQTHTLDSKLHSHFRCDKLRHTNTTAMLRRRVETRIRSHLYIYMKIKSFENNVFFHSGISAKIPNTFSILLRIKINMFSVFLAAIFILDWQTATVSDDTATPNKCLIFFTSIVQLKCMTCVLDSPNYADNYTHLNSEILLSLDSV